MEILDFNRVYYIGRTKDGDVFVRARYELKENGKRVLSLTGVVSPKNNGDAVSAGQIQDHLCEPFTTYAPLWDAQKVRRLYNTWKQWHLNDMNAACEHQRLAGWLKLAGEKAYTYQWKLKREYLDKQKDLQQEAIDRAASTTSASMGFSGEEKRLLKIDAFIKTTTPELTGYNAKYYEPTKDSTGTGYFAHVVEKTRGWLSFDEHPDGLLGKPCPTCGYRYGSAWLYEPVPEHVLTWLQTLPTASKRPLWV